MLVMLSAESIVGNAMFPLPSKEFPFTVLIFVPLTSVSCLPLTALATALPDMAFELVAEYVSVTVGIESVSNAFLTPVPFIGSVPVCE